MKACRNSKAEFAVVTGFGGGVSQTRVRPSVVLKMSQFDTQQERGGCSDSEGQSVVVAAVVVANGGSPPNASMGVDNADGSYGRAPSVIIS